MRSLAARRVAAFGIDYLVIVTWIVVIASVEAMVRKRFSVRLRVDMTARQKRVGHIVSFTTLTLPVTLYFAIGEHSGWHGTLGKHLVGIQVSPTPGRSVSLCRSLVRSGLKFTPWEIAHTVIWHSPGRPFASAPTACGRASYGVALSLAAVYFGSIVVGDGRTPYDRVAGTVVRRSLR